MSGIIFVVLAIGWAVYLLPRALKHHDDVDRSRPVQEFSSALRVLGRGVAPARAEAVAPAGSSATKAAPAPAPVLTITREAARQAARRRRRVLGLLLVALAAVSVASYLGYTPWFTTAIPGGLIVVFLVVARLTVRAQQVRRAAPVQPDVVEPAAPASMPAPTPALSVDEVEPDLGNEDTTGLSREALAQAVAAPVLDEGGLWDPLPVTLPTYVSKARARRTVRTIELTGADAGITSSGHDAADSALAAEAREAEQKAAPQADEAETRKAAGA